MNTVSKIVYAANTGSMGDMENKACDAYRAWALSEIRKEYPTADIVIDASDCARSYVVAEDIDDEQDALKFISRLWDRQ